MCWALQWFYSHFDYCYKHFLYLLDEDGGGSGDDYLKVDSAWHGDIDSDADSVDSEEEDPLKWVYSDFCEFCVANYFKHFI